MSQQRLAEAAGISPGYVALIETGRRGKHPRRDVAVALAQALDAPVAEFLAAAGRLTEADEAALSGTPSFEAVVQGDPRLRADQKRALIDLYRSWVGPADS